MAGLRSNLDTRVADLRTEMHANASSNMRQTYLALLSQMAVLLGIAYFCVAHLHRYA
jgi:hypothetical protein